MTYTGRGSVEDEFDCGPADGARDGDEAGNEAELASAILTKGMW